VWSVIGAIAATTPLRVITAVTCPTTRIHPAIVAQAAATCAVMLHGRFELGVGTGEALNEHILGDRWPPIDVRLAMLTEAVGLMRQLWGGDEVTHRGEHYMVENARIYSLPATPPPVLMSGFGPKATRVAAAIADGYVSTRPDAALVDEYRRAGGTGTASAGLKVCWGPDRDECARLAHRLWRTSGVPGELSQQLPTPALFDQAASTVTVESVADSIPCGPEVEPIVHAVRSYVDAGFDRVFISQIGPNQSGFFRFFEQELSAELATMGATRSGDGDTAFASSPTS
jgi:G6PDH family F420-dependent oxidoreductase